MKRFLSILMTVTLLPVTLPAKAETLVLGGGCFWCTEAAYKLLPGVKSVVSGYAGGTLKRPTYAEVCEGTTGHAEVIRIAYDPAKITVEALLDFFWEAHDPTTLNRQGADVGSQYRSIILYNSEAQREAAQQSLARAQMQLSASIVTEVVPLDHFWPAEAIHQDYFKNNPQSGYCRVVIAPKIKKLKEGLLPMR